jgi:aldehyde dehydrogenase (NAD+)
MAKPAAKIREEYYNYIAGEWVAPKSGSYIENRNPADRDDLVGLYPKSGKADVDRAVQAAHAAFTAARMAFQFTESSMIR